MTVRMLRPGRLKTFLTASAKNDMDHLKSAPLAAFQSTVPPAAGIFQIAECDPFGSYRGSDVSE
jgi:hypothetical protein